MEWSLHTCFKNQEPTGQRKVLHWGKFLVPSGRKTLEMSPDSLETESFMCSLEIIAKKKTEGQYYWLGEGVDETTSPPSPK